LHLGQNGLFQPVTRKLEHNENHFKNGTPTISSSVEDLRHHVTKPVNGNNHKLNGNCNGHNHEPMFNGLKRKLDSNGNHHVKQLNGYHRAEINETMRNSPNLNNSLSNLITVSKVKTEPVICNTSVNNNGHLQDDRKLVKNLLNGMHQNTASTELKIERPKKIQILNGEYPPKTCMTSQLPTSTVMTSETHHNTTSHPRNPYDYPSSPLNHDLMPNMRSQSCSYHYSPINSTTPQKVRNPSNYMNEMPEKVNELCSLNHDQVVCAVSIGSNVQQRHLVYTGGKGCVKIWDISQCEPSSEISKPLEHIDCLDNESYIRSCKVINEGKSLLIGGESSLISVWDLNCGGAPKLKANLESPSAACYALVISQDSKICFSCCSDGNINMWDIHNQKLIRQFIGHTDGASCIDICENKLFTGGLDNTVRCWDICQNKQTSLINLNSQVFTLGYSPKNNWIAVGMENNNIEVYNEENNEKYQIKYHENCVLSLKYSHKYDWFISTGKDNMINGWKSPYGGHVFNLKENSSVLSCDISKDDKFIVTGSGDKKATVYQCNYK